MLGRIPDDITNESGPTGSSSNLEDAILYLDGLHECSGVSQEVVIQALMNRLLIPSIGESYYLPESTVLVGSLNSSASRSATSTHLLQYFNKHVRRFHQNARRRVSIAF